MGEIANLTVPGENMQIGTYKNPGKVGECYTVKGSKGIYKISVLDYIRGDKVLHIYKKHQLLSIMPYIDENVADIIVRNPFVMENPILRNMVIAIIENPFRNPKNGYEYLLVKIKVKYIIGEKSSVSISPSDFKIYYNGAGHDCKYINLPDTYHKLEFVDLIPGGETEGWLVYEVPKDTDVLLSFNEWHKPIFFIKIG